MINIGQPWRFWGSLPADGVRFNGVGGRPSSAPKIR
jgi:hypothetical protein